MVFLEADQAGENSSRKQIIREYIWASSGVGDGKKITGSKLRVAVEKRQRGSHSAIRILMENVLKGLVHVIIKEKFIIKPV